MLGSSEFGKKSSPNDTLPFAASTAAASAVCMAGHLAEPNPSGVSAMLNDLSTTSSTFTAIGAAASLVPPQVSVAPAAPPSPGPLMLRPPLPAPLPLLLPPLAALLPPALPRPPLPPPFTKLVPELEPHA